jgi:hypothetical protein
MTGIRTHVVDDLELAGVRIVFVRDEGNGYRAVWGPGQPTQVFVSPGDNAVRNDVEPLRLTDDQARSLLAGLLAHYQGGDDLRSLRRDYDAERARVDKLVDAVLDRLTAEVRLART